MSQPVPSPVAPAADALSGAPEPWERWETTLVLGSIAVGGMIVTFLGAWLLSLAGRLERTAVKHAYWMGCPRCGPGQDVMTGLASCAHCGLKVKTEVL